MPRTKNAAPTARTEWALAQAIRDAADAQVTQDAADALARSTDRQGLAKPKAIAEYLETTEPALAQMRYVGCGPKFIKISGRQVRYRWSDVEQWLDEQTRVRT